MLMQHWAWKLVGVEKPRAAQGPQRECSRRTASSKPVFGLFTLLCWDISVLRSVYGVETSVNKPST